MRLWPRYWREKRTISDLEKYVPILFEEMRNVNIKKKER